MRDFRHRAIPDSNYEEQELAGWRDQAEHLLAAEASEEKDAKAATSIEKRKIHRLATSDLAHATEWQFKVSANKSLKDICMDEEARPLPVLHKRYRVTFNWDMGPDNLCFTGYLLNKKRCRSSVFFSATHICQRMMWGGVQNVGKYSVCLVGGIIVANERGPWKGEANYQAAKESLDDLKTKSKPGDKLINFFSQRVAADRGEDPTDANCYDWQLDFIDKMDDANWYRRKPPKTTMTQWNTWNDSMEYMLPE